MEVDTCDIIIANPGHIIGELITGYVRLKLFSPMYFKDVYVKIEGMAQTYWIEIREYEVEVNGKKEKRKQEIRHDYYYKFYESSPFFGYDEKHHLDGKMVRELAPGVYKFPFTARVPEDLEVPVFFKYDIKSYYRMYAVIQRQARTALTSDYYRLPFCIQKNYKPKVPYEANRSSSNMPVKLTISNKEPSLGEWIEGQIECSNDHTTKLDMWMYIESRHIYHDTNYYDKTETKFFEPVRSKAKVVIPFRIQVPIDFTVTVHYGEFHVNSKLCLHGGTALHGVNIEIPLTIRAYVTDKNLMYERSIVAGHKRDFDETIPFYGGQDYPSPAYYKIVNDKLPIGVERFVSKDGDRYYVSHFTRKTSITDEMTLPSRFSYPLYNAMTLPEGWSYGKNGFDLFFVNHNNQTTQWEDPRPENERFIPHIKMEKDATLEIELIQGIAMPMRSLFLPSVYAYAFNNKKRRISTKTIKSTMDPVFVEQKKLIIQLDKERMNVNLYFYDKFKFKNDKYIGCIVFDLQYFPPNTLVEGWFQLDCCGNTSIPSTGKIYLKALYRIDSETNIPHVLVNGESFLTEDYYPNTEKMRKQLKKQEKKRENKRFSDNPMSFVDDEIYCEVPY